MRHSLILCAATATLAGGIIFAQPPGNSRPGAVHSQEAQDCPIRAHPDVEHLRQVLNLTDTQQEQARKIFQQARQSAQPIREELKQGREKLTAAAKAGNSESEIQKLAAEQGRLLGKLIAIRTEAHSKFYQLLTPEQRVKCDQMREQFRQRMRSERPGTESRQ